MGTYFRLAPEQASTFAGPVDTLYWFLVGLSVFFTGLVFLLILYFAIKYRRRTDRVYVQHLPVSHRMEFTWMGLLLIAFLIIFAWGARLYAMMMLTAPANAIEVFALGKQWMWQFQHPGGQREIDELHVPVGHPVRMIMTSQDVIHSFYVPAFRVKMDVVPGRYTSLWFEATRPGVYHLFCAEYCGTAHSGMRGRVVVLPPAQYQEWLRGNRTTEPMASVGAQLIQKLGCDVCHGAGDQAPSLAGVFGSSVALASGETVLADESYIRESILQPRAKIVAGYTPVMPTFQGQLSEEDLAQLVSYIKSLGTTPAGGR